MGPRETQSFMILFHSLTDIFPIGDGVKKFERKKLENHWQCLHSGKTRFFSRADFLKPGFLSLYKADALNGEKENLS